MLSTISSKLVLKLVPSMADDRLVRERLVPERVVVAMCSLGFGSWTSDRPL
jgi:hypothetical protein